MYEVPCGVFNRNYNEEMAIVRTRRRWILLIAGGLILLAAPYYLSESMLTTLITMAIWTVAALGLNFLTGYCGEISIGHAAFMGIGAYASAILATDYSFPFWVALPCAALFTGMIGLIFALPATRMKGFYLAIVTLAAQVIFSWVAYKWRDLTGGHEGMMVPSPQIGEWVLDTEKNWFYISAIVALIMGIGAKNMARSNVGRAFVAIRDNDLAAEVMGINLFKYKSIAFFIGCAYAGVAGSMWGHWVMHISPEHFSLHESIWYLGMIIVGGMGKIMGPVFGVVFVFFLQRIITITVPYIGELFPAFSTQLLSSFGLIVFGAVVAFFLIFEPRGIAHLWDKFKNYYRLWPFTY
ncbi:MAG: branched-chain amino acid ABC transporter permease [Thermodesulfobacteriota bacterium]|nr:branched-chain amino acid ABC transporter permease [Thermodesulfobacteriota bacterium]